MTSGAPVAFWQKRWGESLQFWVRCFSASHKHQREKWGRLAWMGLSVPKCACEKNAVVFSLAFSKTRCSWKTRKRTTEQKRFFYHTTSTILLTRGVRGLYQTWLCFQPPCSFTSKHYHRHQRLANQMKVHIRMSFVMDGRLCPCSPAKLMQMWQLCSISVQDALTGCRPCGYILKCILYLLEVYLVGGVHWHATVL